MAEKIYIGIDNLKIEATGDALEQILSDRQSFADRKNAIDLELAAKAEAKAALLNRLGITAEEAELLLG